MTLWFDDVLPEILMSCLQMYVPRLEIHLVVHQSATASFFAEGRLKILSLPYSNQTFLYQRDLRMAPLVLSHGYFTFPTKMIYRGISANVPSFNQCASLLKHDLKIKNDLHNIKCPMYWPRTKHFFCFAKEETCNSVEHGEFIRPSLIVSTM